MAEDIRNMLNADTSEILKRLRAIAPDLWRDKPGYDTAEPEDFPEKDPEKPEKETVKTPKISIDNLWMTADETIDWTDALAHDEPTDGLTSLILWRFYHNRAEAVLSGDLNAYAEVLRKANPLGELTEFGRGIQIKAPDPDRLEAKFTVMEEFMADHPAKYLSAMGIRIARDLLACLPVSIIQVKAFREEKTVMEATYRREQLHHRNFSFLDPEKLAAECGARFYDMEPDAGQKRLTE